MQTWSMQTRSQSRILSDDIKPIIKSSPCDRYISLINPHFGFIKSELNECLVNVRQNIKVDIKNEIDEKINSTGNEMTDLNDDNLKESECEKTKKIQCPKCYNCYSEVGFTRHSCGSFGCEKCGKRFTYRSKFESHLRKHALIEERQLLSETTTCEICNSVVRIAYMKKHSKIHENRQTCTKCGAVFSQDQMKVHIKTHFKYKCDICGKMSQCLENHERHVEMHNKEKRHPCDECQLSFQHLVELARHVTKAHRQIEEGKYECLFCKKIVSAIAHHLRTHQKDPKTCEICGVTLRNYSAYKSHIRYHDILLKSGNNRTIIPKHLMERNIPMDCSCCDKTFQNKSLLINHFKSHMTFRLYPCPYCELNTSESLSDLLQHIGTVHRSLPDSQHECNFCYSTVENIKTHLHTHRADRFHCEICNVTSFLRQDHKKHYNRRHKLKKNERSPLHELMDKYATPRLNSRRVFCLECGFKVRISHMRSHIAAHQTFKCMMCQKVFFHQFLLKAHERSHQRFSQRCPVCSQSFLSHVRMMAHLKMYHKMAFSASRSCLKCKI